MPLFAHYPLHGNVKDAAGTNDGTNNGATETGGVLGTSAYYYDGSTYSTVPLASFGSRVQRHTVSVWLKWNHTNSETPIMGLSWNGGGDKLNFTINRNRSGGEEGEVFSTLKGSGSSLAYRTDGANINDGEWHHVVFRVIDSSNNDVEIWIDGQNHPISFRNSSGPNSFSDLGYDFCLGGVNGDGSIVPGGPIHITDLRFYDHTLSPLEIQYLYEVSQVGSTVSEKQTL